MGRVQLEDPDRRHSVRRLEGEPDAGRLTHWMRAPGGYRYQVDARGGPCAGYVTWREVAELIDKRLTPVRYRALREAVEQGRAHEDAYMPSPIPFRTPEIWDAQFYRTWSRRSADLALRAAAALNAIPPAAVAHPVLF